MKAAQVDVVERTTQLLTSFNLSTAAPELGHASAPRRATSARQNLRGP